MAKNIGKMVEVAIEKAKKEDPILVGELTQLLVKPSYQSLCAFLVDTKHGDWIWMLEKLSVGNLATTKEITGNEAIVCVHNARGKAFTLADIAKKFGIGIVSIKLINGDQAQRLWPQVTDALVPAAHITGDEANIAKLVEEAKNRDVGLGMKTGKEFKEALEEFTRWV